jgi:hypothetical protein
LKNKAWRGGRAVEGTGLENLCLLFYHTFSGHIRPEMLRFFLTYTIPDHITADQSGHYVGTRTIPKTGSLAEGRVAFSKISESRHNR